MALSGDVRLGENEVVSVLRGLAEWQWGWKQLSEVISPRLCSKSSGASSNAWVEGFCSPRCCFVGSRTQTERREGVDTRPNPRRDRLVEKCATANTNRSGLAYFGIGQPKRFA